ncbi:MAG: HNH endonuclease, partial [Cyanobacteria bacterium J06636_16]
MPVALVAAASTASAKVKFSPDPFSIEHIIPLSRGGTNDLDNLALACQGCNNHKYIQTDAYDPISGVKVSLYNPRFHNWQEHFTWNQDFTLLLGLTPTGRATVDRLQLNREGVVNLRRV